MSNQNILTMCESELKIISGEIIQQLPKSTTPDLNAFYLVIHVIYPYSLSTLHSTGHAMQSKNGHASCIPYVTDDIDFTEKKLTRHLSCCDD